MSRILVWAFLCALLAGPLVGCGDGNLPTYEVIGKVEFDDGTHPKFGDIEFYSHKHKVNARGNIDRDGYFTVSTYEEGDGAVEGLHQIVIMQQVGNYLLANTDQQIKHDHGSLIKPSYFDYRTSGLSCEIVPGEKNPVTLIIEKRPDQTSEGMVEH